MNPAALAEPWPLVARRGELEEFSGALADTACRSFLIYGSAGVGKTRLADECLKVASVAGHACGRAVAAPGIDAIPLGAIAHLVHVDLAGGVPLDAVRVFDRASQTIWDQGEGERFVVMVDDLQYLDVSSTTLVLQLLETGLLFLVATIRSEVDAPPAISALWSHDACVRVDLGELSRESAETLMHLALGGPLDGPTSHTFWSNSGGNVLLLRELVLASLQSGALIDDEGVWRFDRPFTSSPRLADLVARRIGAVGDDGRRALELLALCEPLGVEVIARDAGAEVPGALERAGLINLRRDGRRQELHLVHPVHREVLRERTPVLHRRALLLSQVAAIEAFGSRRREDALRAATWRLEATGTADPELLVRAARLARYTSDFDRVVNLARAAEKQRPTTEGGALLGEALCHLGSFTESESVLVQSSVLIEDDAERVTIAALRSNNLLWGLERAHDAFEVNGAAQSVVVKQEARDELRAREASIHVFSGSPHRALEVLDMIGESQSLRAQVTRAVPEAIALAVTGFPQRAVAVARQGAEARAQLGDELAIEHPVWLVAAEAFALCEAGRLVEATVLAQSGYQAASGKQLPIAQILLALTLGRVALITGRPQTSRRWFREALARGRATGFDGPARLALSGLAAAEALLGEARAARAVAREMSARSGLDFLEPGGALGRAWSLVASGDVAGAVSVLSAGALDARTSGHVTAASWMLHDIARLGHASLVADDLADLSRLAESDLVSARAAHAAALQAQAMDDLEDAGNRLEALGALLVAAEAFSAGADAAARAGHARTGSRLASRAAALSAECEGARSPALLRSRAIVPLTPREHEIALLAAAGTSSREIGGRLFLSVRTVDNHLHHIYLKLGVASRQELSAALQPTDEDEKP